MTDRSSAGFTIIEVVLFLAISSLMAVGLMVGTSLAIRSQQYRDSVESYASFLKSEFGRVVSVENDRQSSQSCPIIDGESAPRGRSNCVIIGRYISSIADSEYGENQEFSSRPIYALAVGEAWKIDMGGPDDSYVTNWNAAVNMANSGRVTPVRLAMFRDPSYGNLRIVPVEAAIGGTTLTEQLKKVIDGAVSADSSELCVLSNGWQTSQARSIFLTSSAGSSDAIRVGNSTGVCAA